MALCRKGLIAVLVLGFVLLISSPNVFAAYTYKSGKDINAMGYTHDIGGRNNNHDGNTVEWKINDSDSGKFSGWRSTRRHGHEPRDVNTLEWKINDSDWGRLSDGRYNDGGRNHHANDGGRHHHDNDKPPAVPIPNAAWLLGSGVVALFVLKRRRPKT